MIESRSEVSDYHQGLEGFYALADKLDAASCREK